MSIRNAPRVVSFDADAALGAVEDTVEGTLRSFVEYDAIEFNPLYVDDVTLSFYRDEEHMRSHFEKIHDHVQMDFYEQSLFTEDLFPVTDRVRYQATGFELFTLLRVYREREGLFLAVDVDEPVVPLVEAVESAFGDD